MKRNQKGFNLISIQLSMALMFIVILVFGDAFALSIKTSQNADIRFRIIMYVNSGIELIKNNPPRYLNSQGELKLIQKLGKKINSKKVNINLTWEKLLNKTFKVTLEVKTDKIKERGEFIATI